MPPLLDWIPQVSPRFESPRHLSRLCELVQQTLVRPVRVLVSVPPRHGKTETLNHGMAWLLSIDPRKRLAYVPYGADLARKQSRRIRSLCIETGVQLAHDNKSVTEWSTASGGGLRAASIDSGHTGHGYDLVVIDDPFKNRAEAESALIRERVYDAWTSSIATRVEPGGSVFVVHTRWHEDDLIGRLLAAEEGWEYVHIPAIDDDGQALWPARFDAEALRKIESTVGAYDWASLYQGQPRPKGGRLFGDVALFDAFPTSAIYTIGVDFAYSSKKTADYNVAVVLAKHTTYEGALPVERLDIVEMVRRQCPAPEFATTLRELQARYAGARCRAYIGGTEKGIVDFLRRDGVHVEALPATADKFTRAQAYAAAWNRGAIRVQRGAPWASALVSEHAAFTGVNDAHDDTVDAAVAAYDAHAYAPSVAVASSSAGRTMRRGVAVG